MEHALRTTVRGRRVEFPGTIDDIRASLPAEQRAEFDREIGAAPIMDVPLIAFRWSYPPEAREEDDEIVARIKAGEFAGVTYLDVDGDGPAAP